MYVPDLLENARRECGDCEHFVGKPAYKQTGNCAIREELFTQSTTADGMPKPIRIEATMRAIECAQDCEHFEWSDEARRDLEDAILTGQVIIPIERRA